MATNKISELIEELRTTNDNGVMRKDLLITLLERGLAIFSDEMTPIQEDLVIKTALAAYTKAINGVSSTNDDFFDNDLSDLPFDDEDDDYDEAMTQVSNIWGMDDGEDLTLSLEAKYDKGLLKQAFIEYFEAREETFTIAQEQRDRVVFNLKYRLRNCPAELDIYILANIGVYSFEISYMTMGDPVYSMVLNQKLSDLNKTLPRGAFYFDDCTGKIALLYNFPIRGNEPDFKEIEENLAYMMMAADFEYSGIYPYAVGRLTKLERGHAIASAERLIAELKALD